MSSSREFPSPRELLTRIWPALFLIMMVSSFTVAVKVNVGANMLSQRSIQAILVFATLILLLGAAETFVILTAGIDLSVGFTLGLSAIVAALVMKAFNTAPALATVTAGLVAALFAGALAGSINGWLIAKLKVPSFIATLGMGGVVFGVALLLSGGTPISGLPKYLGRLGNGYVFGSHQLIPYTVVATAVVVAGAWFLLAKTQFGRHVYAMGGNFEAARRAGVPVERVTIQVYALAGLLAGFAGALWSVRFTSGAADAGESLLLTAIAAVVIGGASLFGGEGRMSGTIIGSLIIATIQFGLVLLGVVPFWQFVAVGLVVILAVVVDQYGQLLKRAS